MAGISADPWPGWSPYVWRPLTHCTLAAPLQCTQANHPVGYAKTQETSFTGEPRRSMPPKMVLGRDGPHPAHTSRLKKSFLLWNGSTSHHIVTEYDSLQHHLFNKLTFIWQDLTDLTPLKSTFSNISIFSSIISNKSGSEQWNSITIMTLKLYILNTKYIYLSIQVDVGRDLSECELIWANVWCEPGLKSQMWWWPPDPGHDHTIQQKMHNEKSCKYSSRMGSNCVKDKQLVWF